MKEWSLLARVVKAKRHKTGAACDWI